ncbi:PBP1A family penicillin-binding protein [Geomonas paludis]|uniref:peptidoglycan glycosyltransferase n=1 Tax=Geomonas paludis TaxID=2740185 RepID=A0ABY4LJM8_9BACT|nr:PBP1A family penicillin-binding protein [Geomonas paludis]UPU36698.1 PBP1A family penicillin-binding protein [Geomonas paludis]
MLSRRYASLKKLVSPVLLVIVLALTCAVSAHASIATYPELPTGYTSIRVFDGQQRYVGRILPTQRYWVSIDRIPLFLRKALVATEDARFYEHGGIDVRGIARALVKDVVKGRLAEGGSTITQQLIKNKFLTGEKSLDRKVKEVQLAMDFEKKYTKDQILEMYFNEIYFGNGAWGIAQAARQYFDKNPEELTEAECAILAGVPKNPGRYNPLGDQAKVSARRSVVLSRMVAVKMITPQQKRAIEARPATVIKPGQAQGYLDLVRKQLVERYGAHIVEQGGLDVISAMDVNLQKQAEQVLREGVKKVNPSLQGALICMDLKTGDVLAAVGGVDNGKGGFNRAFSAKRQPGSSIKPLIFAAALEQGYTPASLLDDTPVAYNKGNGQTWRPHNYEKKSFGELSLRQALAHSNNVITVKLLESLGVNNFVTFAGRLGLTLRTPNDLSLALGTDEVTLNDLVSAYSPLANAGMRSEGRTIIRVFDRNRKSWSENPSQVAPVLSPATAFVTTSMMKDVLTYGTAKGLKNFARQRPAAGKTGTTDDYRDAWFVGYTPQLITGVWVGYDKPKPGGRGFTGGAVSAPIWERFMRVASQGKPAVDFTRPEGVVAVNIDPSTGQLATPTCPTAQEEDFIAGTEPTTYCSKHGGDAIPPVAPAQPLQPGVTAPGSEPPAKQPADEGGEDGDGTEGATGLEGDVLR